MTFVIFDIDGTLLYSNSIDSRCFAEAYQVAFQRVFPTIDWTKYPQVTDHIIFQTAFRQHFSRNPLEAERYFFECKYLELLKLKRKSSPDKFCALPGVQKLIDYLDSLSDHQIGIATGGWKRPAAIKLRHIQLEPTRFYAAYADDMHHRADILRSALDLFHADGHTATRIVYVGDAIWDATTTREMNLPMIGIRRLGDVDVLYKQGVRPVLTNYLDVNAFIQALDEAEVPYPVD